MFSSHRGNGVDDPRPIPDLGGPKARLKIDQSPDRRALEPFIHGLVTQEFDGAEPPPAVLAGLAAYVRALDPKACPAGDAPLRLRVSDYAQDVDRAVRAAQGALAVRDTATALAMIGAARSRLGDIAERYDQSPALQRRLAANSAWLARSAERLRTGDVVNGMVGLAAWRDAWPGEARRLRREESRSLFAPARLAGAARLPRGG